LFCLYIDGHNVRSRCSRSRSLRTGPHRPLLRTIQFSRTEGKPGLPKGRRLVAHLLLPVNSFFSSRLGTFFRREATCSWPLSACQPFFWSTDVFYLAPLKKP